MRKQVIISLTLLTIISASGCGNLGEKGEVREEGSESKGGISTSVAPVTPAPSTLQATVGTMTPANIGEKLLAAGFPYTTKDETSDLAGIASKAATGTATKYKIKGTAGNIDVTVITITNPAKVNDVKKDIEAQWAVVKKISTTANMEFIDVGAENLLVTFSYKTGDKEQAMTVKSAIAKK
ncbi:MAG: hypothetical protein WC101_03245 [Candidatus Gracilibacteria bacterium]